MFSLRSSLVLFMIFSCTVPAKTLAKQSAACFVSVMREPSTTLRRRHSRLFSIVPAKTLAKHQPVACFVGVMRKPTTLRRHSHLFSSPITSTLELSIPTAQDMDDLGAVLSMDTGPGDTLLLGGDLGAGKTCFSRGFVRARTGDLEQRVTSPTFLLSNTYDAGDVLIHHMDLYRLTGDEKDLAPLDMANVLTNCIALIEWPALLGSMTPDVRLDVSFRIQDDDNAGGTMPNDDDDVEDVTRLVTLEAHGDKWAKRLELLVDEGYVDDLLLEE